MRNMYIFILVSFVAAISACQNADKAAVNGRMNMKFEWSPAASSAYLYPMETYRCKFIFADSSSTGPVTKVVSTEWGESGGISVVGDAFKPVPIALDICWLSYTENKFYQGHFELPYAKMLQQFKDGFEDYTWTSDTEYHLTRHTYDNIIAGMAPGGVVVVWLSGSGMQVEVGRFQAKETSVNMADFLDRDDIKMSRDAYVKDELSRLKDVTNNIDKNGIPYGLWDKYRERFNFRPVIKYDQPQPIKISDLTLEYFNGEKENLFEDRIEKTGLSPKARVKGMHAAWVASVANKPMSYVLEIKFDEAEIFKAYQEVYGDNPNQPAELVVEVDKKNSGYQVFLQGQQQKIVLLKQKGEIYYDNLINVNNLIVIKVNRKIDFQSIIEDL